MGSIGRGMVASATVVMMAEEEIDVLVEIERGNGSLTLVFCDGCLVGRFRRLRK
jgi:hypothetical protein